jgi:putative N6-adenine-specific DNA methylase
VAKFIGLRTTRKIPLYNGPIECRFLKYEIYDGSKKAKKQTSEDDL